jgi:hypothetical protein
MTQRLVGGRALKVLLRTFVNTVVNGLFCLERNNVARFQTETVVDPSSSGWVMLDGRYGATYAWVRDPNRNSDEDDTWYLIRHGEPFLLLGSTIEIAPSELDRTSVVCVCWVNSPEYAMGPISFKEIDMALASSTGVGDNCSLIQFAECGWATDGDTNVINQVLSGAVTVTGTALLTSKLLYEMGSDAGGSYLTALSFLYPAVESVIGDSVTNQPVAFSGTWPQAGHVVSIRCTPPPAVTGVTFQVRINVPEKRAIK